MAYVVRDASKFKQRAVIQFLTAEGGKSADIVRRMKDVYGDGCMSKTQVYELAHHFRNGRDDLGDDPRPGQANVVIRDANVAKVDACVQANRRIRIKQLSEELELSVGTIHTILHEYLLYRKVCAAWVPKLLTEHHTSLRMAYSLLHATRYNQEGEEFLDRIVTGDESWCYHYDPESKRQSAQWKHPASPPPKKIKRSLSLNKVMLTLFFDVNGPVLVEFMPKGTTINAQRYCDTLDRLRAAIKTRRPGMLTRGVILLHDNATPHTANMSAEKLRKFKWELLEHPPYNPDLAPCDYRIFAPLKKELRGHRFNSDDEVKEAVRNWLHAQPKLFYDHAIRALVTRWDKCLNAQGNYF